jgi:transposase
MASLGRPSRNSPEVRQHAVRIVQEHGPEHPPQWAVIQSDAATLGRRDETFRRWLREAERESGGHARCP